MSQMFNRAYQISIGPRGGTGIKIRHLRVNFFVEKNLEKTPNSARIQIYNLSKESRGFIEQKQNVLILEAGYGYWKRLIQGADESFQGEIKKLFIGDIAKIKTERNGPDIITTIECGDGEVAYNIAKMNLNFTPGVKLGQVLNSITSSFGLTKGPIIGVNENEEFTQGLTLSGPTKDHMDVIAKKQNLEWSIQDDQLQILPPDQGTTQVAVLLNKSTGLIGSPFRDKVVNQDIIKKKDGKEAEAGVEATSLLNAEIKPGRYVKIESSLVSGVFKVKKVTHEGDTHSLNWYTRLEAK